MKATVILIVPGTLGTIHKDFVRRLEKLGIEGRAEIIQTEELLRSVVMLGKVLVTRDLLSLRLQ